MSSFALKLLRQVAHHTISIQTGLKKRFEESNRMYQQGAISMYLVVPFFRRYGAMLPQV